VSSQRSASGIIRQIDPSCPISEWREIRYHFEPGPDATDVRDVDRVSPATAAKPLHDREFRRGNSDAIHSVVGDARTHWAPHRTSCAPLKLVTVGGEPERSTYPETAQSVPGVIISSRLEVPTLEVLDTLLPEFGDFWIEKCTEAVARRGGTPPNITAPVYLDQTTYAYPETVAGQGNQDAMNAYLQVHGNDLVSRFAVLRYLWAASLASGPPDSHLGYVDALLDGGIDAASDAADQELRIAVRPLLAEFVDRLPPEFITSPEQATWEIKQAVILSRPDRLKRLAQRYRSITDQPADQSNLMLARALWLPSGRFYEVVSGRNDLQWESFIEKGNHDNPLFHVSPPELDATDTDKYSLVDAIACLQKVSQEVLGPHWGVLADCWLRTGRPEECAKIWEHHGLEILNSAADSNGRRASEVLLLPDYQLRIADLWAAGDRIDKEVEVLESLRQRNPRLAGVNRRLAECYQRMSPSDDERAAQRAHDEAGCDEAFSQDPIVRLFIHQYEKSFEAERQLDEARAKYESNPASIGQRTAIRNILRLTWSPLDRLSHDVQQDWVAGLWWCYGDHPPESDETERAEYGLTKCTRALETQLRETLFEPLKKAATESEKKQLSDPELKSYLPGEREHIDLGPMLEAIRSADPSRAGVFKRLWDLLGKRSARARELTDGQWRDIGLIRNPSSHESRRAISGASMERARRCTELCCEFLSILESPPAPPHAAARPGQPVPKR